MGEKGLGKRKRKRQWAEKEETKLSKGEVES